MRTEFVRISVTLPKDLRSKFDEIIEGKYASRSAAIQDLMRRLIRELQEA